MKNKIIFIIIIFILLFLLWFFKYGNNPKIKFGVDIILPISDTSLLILYYNHEGPNVYAGDGSNFQYWNGKPTGWKKYYISPIAKQIILNKKEIFDLLTNSYVIIERNNKKILIQRIYEEYSDNPNHFWLEECNQHGKY